MRLVICIATLLAMTATLFAGEADELIRKARAALKKGDAAAALDAATKAVEADPKSSDAIFMRGEAYAAQRKHAEAIKDYEAALALDKTYLIAQNQRGGERFKLGMIQESIDDFNAYLKVYPKDEPGHWRRGISFYYAGKYAEGAKQFYDGRVVFGADVENAFWHFLCNARKDGPEKARKNLLALDGDDKRIPMMRVYDMLQAKVKPAEVIETAEQAKLEGDARTEALFYAHLYVALYFEAVGEPDKCKEYLTPAVEKYQIGHYMWDVANVHLGRLKKKG
jgi:lipoprotein NlpI